MDLAKPKPFFLSCKRVAPCADCAGGVIDKPLVCVAAVILATWGAARPMVCLKAVAVDGEIAYMIVDVCCD